MQAHSATSQVRAAAFGRDYAAAASFARELAPGKETKLEQFRSHMERYEQAKGDCDWRRAMRALADARQAAVEAGLPELEGVATARLYELVQLYKDSRS